MADSFTTKLSRLADARYTGVWVTTYETDRTLLDVNTALAVDGSPYQLWLWDFCNGLTDMSGRMPPPGVPTNSPQPDPKTREILVALSAATKYMPNDDQPFHRLLFMKNLHRFLPATDVMQTLANLLSDTAGRLTIVGLSHSPTVVPELEKYFTLLEYDLPGRDELTVIAREVAVGNSLPDAENRDYRGVADAMSGLTRAGADNAAAFSLASVENPTEIDANIIWDVKSADIKKSGLLQIYNSKEGFECLGGLENLKQFGKRILTGRHDNPDLRPKGIVLAGLPGCLHGDTPIFDPVDGTTVSVQDRWAAGQMFHVVSRGLDGSPVIALAMEPTKFEPADMLRFTTSSGETLIVTKHHRFWNGSRYVFADEVADTIRAGGVYRLPTIGDSDQQVLQQDARRYWNTAEDFQENCSVCFDLDDAQLRAVEEADQVFEPSPVDAQVRSLICEPLGDLDSKSVRSRFCQLDDRQSTPDLPPLEGIEKTRELALSQAEEFALRDFVLSRASQPLAIESDLICTVERQALDVVASTRFGRPERTDQICAVADLWSIAPTCTELQSEVATCPVGTGEETFRLHSAGTACEALDDSSVWYTDEDYNMTSLIAVQDYGTEAYFDFHVPGYANYWAVGMFHHNTGKSQFCKALGKECGRRTIVLDPGSLKGSLVGDTERKTRDALKLIDAMEPAIVMIEEGEKVFGAAFQSSNVVDGVSTGQFGTLLTWLNDHTSDVFVVMTVNDATKFPPEFMRAERFDAVFFLDLPTAAERKQIWDGYFKRYEIDPAQTLPNDYNWTGAEIRACCRLSKLLGVTLEAAALQIVPVAERSQVVIDKMRDWATDVCLSASEPGRYNKSAHESQLKSTSGNGVHVKQVRRVRRDASSN